MRSDLLPSCLTTLVQQLRDRFTCFVLGPLEPVDLAEALREDLVDAEREIDTLRAALAEALKSKALAEENADRCDLDLRDVLFLRGAMREHPSFGGDQ